MSIPTHISRKTGGEGQSRDAGEAAQATPMAVDVQAQSQQHASNNNNGQGNGGDESGDTVPDLKRRATTVLAVGR